jgi:hypothetical protein
VAVRWRGVVERAGVAGGVGWCGVWLVWVAFPLPSAQPWQYHAFGGRGP